MSEKHLNVCVLCGKEFWSTRKYRTCFACRQKNNGTLILACECCGKDFKVSQYRYGQKYCSQRCASIVSNRRRAEKRKQTKKIDQPKHVTGNVTYTCLACGKEFSSTQKRKYCPACHRKRVMERNRKVSLTCAHCGKEFVVPRYLDYRRFCSVKCSCLGKRQTHFGDHSTGKNWKTTGDVLSKVLEMAEKSYPDRMKQIKLDDEQRAKIAEHLLKEKLKTCGDPFAWFYNHVLFPIPGIDFPASESETHDLIKNLAYALGKYWADQVAVQPSETNYKRWWRS